MLLIFVAPGEAFPQSAGPAQISPARIDSPPGWNGGHSVLPCLLRIHLGHEFSGGRRTPQHKLCGSEAVELVPETSREGNGINARRRLNAESELVAPTRPLPSFS